jgi:hypothetical protein
MSKKIRVYEKERKGNLAFLGPRLNLRKNMNSPINRITPNYTQSGVSNVEGDMPVKSYY